MNWNIKSSNLQIVSNTKVFYIVGKFQIQIFKDSDTSLSHVNWMIHSPLNLPLNIILIEREYHFLLPFHKIVNFDKNIIEKFSKKFQKFLSDVDS